MRGASTCQKRLGPGDVPLAGRRRPPRRCRRPDRTACRGGRRRSPPPEPAPWRRPARAASTEAEGGGGVPDGVEDGVERRVVERRAGTQPGSRAAGSISPSPSGRTAPGTASGRSCRRAGRRRPASRNGASALLRRVAIAGVARRRSETTGVPCASAGMNGAGGAGIDERDRRQLVRRRGGGLDVVPKHRPRSRGRRWRRRRPCPTGWSRIPERGRDAEVAAAAAQRPEEIGVLVGAAVNRRRRP